MKSIFDDAQTRLNEVFSHLELIDDVRTGSAFWRALLLAALLVLVLESVLASSIFSRKKAKPEAPRQTPPEAEGL